MKNAGNADIRNRFPFDLSPLTFDLILWFFLLLTSSAFAQAVDPNPWEKEIPKERISFITPEEIMEKDRHWEPILIIDVRDIPPYSQDHIPAALSFPYFMMIQQGQNLPKEREIILYDDGGASLLSLQAAQLLLWHGYSKVRVLEDGIQGWKSTDLPTARLNPPTPHEWEIKIPNSDVNLIKAAELKKKLDQKEKLLLLDVRNEQAFKEGHIPGAISFFLPKLQRKWHTLPRDQLIILYCGGLGCPLSQRAAKFLMWKGFQNVWELDDGTHAWQAAGFPLEK